MSASVSLSDLSWAAPDGTPLFTRLTLRFGAERAGIVGRNGTGKSTLLRLIAGDLRPASGRVQISGTIAIMRQQALEDPALTIADLFGVRPALARLGRAEAGLADADDLGRADWTLPARIEAALLRCGLSADPQTRLASLSGGQRIRAALAALIFAAPDILLLDEPTNNLDRAGRQAVIDLIRGWKGAAIIVSHDRALLHTVDAIVELSPLGVARYGGNYSAFRQQKDSDLNAARRDLAQAELARAEMALRAQQAAERKACKDRAGQRARVKGDQPKILMDAARGRAEASGGADARLRDSRREAADAALATARRKIAVLEPIHMDIPPTGLPPGRVVLRLDGVTGGYDPDRPLIRDLSLTVTGPRRLAIAGPNGSGKTTLLKLITGQLSPQRGTVALTVPVALLDQHLGLLDPARSVYESFRHLNPAADAHMAHAALARFGFRARHALRRTGELSGGERLRAGLACTLGATPPPMLLILDEPTNHLDLDAIAALETALAAYDGAVLVVSHDEAFLKAIAPHDMIVLGG